MNILHELLVITILTELTTLSIRKILDSFRVDYVSNLIAAFATIVIAVAFKALWAVYYAVAVDGKYLVETVALAYLSFLSATCGYDKVMQAIKQMKE